MIPNIAISEWKKYMTQGVIKLFATFRQKQNKITIDVVISKQYEDVSKLFI